MKIHPHAVWNGASAPLARSSREMDASNRIFSGFFTPLGLQNVARISPADPIYTIGSCFAREIERAMLDLGFTVCGDNDLIRDRIGVCNRFNLASMELEVRRAVGEAAFDNERDLIATLPNGDSYDLHYWQETPSTLDAIIAQRQHLLPFAAQFIEARAIVLTLGLTQALYDRRSGMVCNGIPPAVLVRQRDNFEARFIGLDENIAHLEAIYDCIERHHRDGEFTFFVTVSPVPMGACFSDEDVVVATTRAKSILRAAAEHLRQSRERVVYFPSYEIVTYSDRGLTWMDDRLHVRPECVAHIVDVFAKQYTHCRASAVA